MRISASKSGFIALSQKKRVDCPLWVGEEEDFKYPRSQEIQRKM